MLGAARSSVVRFVVLAAAATAPAAEAAELSPVAVRGELIESVVCQSDPTQSYALYVPKSWDGRSPAPVIFCFDPIARGRVPVERFSAAGERFGYIVAGSNDSRNGPIEAQGAALEAMFDDVLARFPVDRACVVLAGFSGGARLATAVAHHAGFGRAVIACGAGFHDRQVPDAIRFAFVGVVGVDDFNYHEMRDTDAQLSRSKSRGRLFVFEGRHEWPSADVAEMAVAWIELERMRAGDRTPDASLIATVLANALAHAESKPPGDRLLELRAVTEDFDGLVDISAVRAQTDALARTREGRTVVRAERAQKEQQQAGVSELIQLAIDGEYATVRRIADKWRKEAEDSMDTASRRVARRVLGDAGTYGYETGQAALASQQYDRAVSLLELCTAARPEPPVFHFELARAHAGAGDRKRALAVLQDAVDRGFSDVASIEGAREFQALRDDATFATLVATVRTANVR